MAYELYYWPGIPGRGEYPRLVLEAAGADYREMLQLPAAEGGGIRDEGEDIAVLEMTLDEAMSMVADGRILDAKTVMLLQYAALNW